MSARRPCASNFYAGVCSPEQIERYVASFAVPAAIERPVAGIVPHAGWMYSGAIAARVFASFRERHRPSTLVLLGAVHRRGVARNSVYASGAWSTPLGEVEVDEDLARELLTALGPDLATDADAHAGEHSLEVQLPFIRHLLPKTRVVPIALVPDDAAARTGHRIGEAIRAAGLDAAVVGTTDLTHYGDMYGFAPHGRGPRALAWMRENDKRIIDLAVTMAAERVLPEARSHFNACGAGALAATVAAAKALGAGSGLLLQYTTSYDVLPDREFDMGVGYAGIVFSAPGK